MPYTPTEKFGISAGLGGLASGIAGMFNHNKNPADTANEYIGQIPGQTNQYYQPYFDAGRGALPGLQDQYGRLTNDPGGRYNEIGNSYHESPGFKFALQQALQGANHAAAAGGMAGSPQHQQQNMQLATDIANQDYYNYMKGATGLYGAGLQGQQELANMGQKSGMSQADMIAQALAQQGQYGYEGQAAKNEANNSIWGNIGSGLGLLGTFLL